MAATPAAGTFSAHRQPTRAAPAAHPRTRCRWCVWSRCICRVRLPIPGRHSSRAQHPQEDAEVPRWSARCRCKMRACARPANRLAESFRAARRISLTLPAPGVGFTAGGRLALVQELCAIQQSLTHGCAGWLLRARKIPRSGPLDAGVLWCQARDDCERWIHRLERHGRSKRFDSHATARDLSSHVWQLRRGDCPH